MERHAPQPARAAGLEAELERHAAEDQRDQHQQHRQVQRTDSIDARTPWETPRTARRRRARARFRCRPRSARRCSSSDRAACSSSANGVEDADAEHEAVEQHVHQHGEADDEKPDHGQYGSEASSPLIRIRGRPRTAVAPASACASGTCAGAGCGPLRSSLTRYHDAEAEQEKVHNDKSEQRREHTAGRNRTDGVRRAQQAVHDPRLATDLGHIPAGQQRDETAWQSSRMPGAQIPARREQAVPRHHSPSPIAARPQHQQTEADHDAEGEERRSSPAADRAAGKSLRPLISPSQEWVRIRLPRCGTSSAKRLRSFSSSGQREQGQRHAACGVPARLDRGQLGRLVFAHIKAGKIADENLHGHGDRNERAARSLQHRLRLLAMDGRATDSSQRPHRPRTRS